MVKVSAFEADPRGERTEQMLVRDECRKRRMARPRRSRLEDRVPPLPLFRQSDDIRPRNDDDLVLRSGKERNVPGPPGCDAPEDIFRNRQRSGDDVAERDFREVFRDVFRERIVKR